MPLHDREPRAKGRNLHVIGGEKGVLFENNGHAVTSMRCVKKKKKMPHIRKYRRIFTRRNSGSSGGGRGEAETVDVKSSVKFYGVSV